MPSTKIKRGDIMIKRQELSEELKNELDKIDALPSIIVTEISPPNSERKKGSFYFIVSDKNDIPTAENIKVSPTMGIKKV
jgi:hypothetical protein